VAQSEGAVLRSTSELRAVSSSTVATLCVVLLAAGLTQLVVGVNGRFTIRESVLVAATVVAVGLGLAAVPRVMRGSELAGPRSPLILVLIIVSGGLWVVAVIPPFAGWGWAFTLAIAGGLSSCLFRGWRKLAIVVASYFAIGLGGLVEVLGSPTIAEGPLPTGTPSPVVVLVAVVAFGLMPPSAVWFLEIVVRLERARDTASELAIARERLRFATDLHDIQGHNLQVIALKSELAERLLLNDPERSAHELAAIRVIAQTAIDDTRAVVNDYRTVTIAVEVRNAAEVLRAAGIRCEVRIDTPTVPDTVESLLAIAIREASTNVLKHSSASTASITLDLDSGAAHRLTVTNDGALEFRHGGTGLAGLSSRVTAVQGSVSTEHQGDQFTLIVRIPAKSWSGELSA